MAELRSVLATEPELSARAIWALSRSWDQQLITKTHQVFADATHHKSPLVKRAAYEAIAALPTHVVQLEPNPDWLAWEPDMPTHNAFSYAFVDYAFIGEKWHADAAFKWLGDAAFGA